MTRGLSVLAIALAAALLTGCQDKAANDAAFGQRVRAYLLAHPEVLQESARRLDAKLAEDELATERQGAERLPRLRAAVERDPADFVAHPDGAVTVTEFYDYRCPHCINAAPRVVALIRDHPQVRFVFKEMPIFGPVSEHAARAALAVKAASGDYLGLYSALMTTTSSGRNERDTSRFATKSRRASVLSPPSFMARCAR